MMNLWQELDASAGNLRGTKGTHMKSKLTAFEATKYAQCVRKEHRCYPLGQMVQHSHALGAPAAAWKIDHRGTFSAQQEMI